MSQNGNHPLPLTLTAYPTLDCLAVSVFFSLISLQASVTVKNRGGAISNDRMHGSSESLRL